MKMVYSALFTGIFLSACTVSSNTSSLAPTGINNSSGKTPIRAATCIHENWKSLYPAAKIQRLTTNFYIVTIPGSDTDIAQAHIESGTLLTAQVKLVARPDSNPQIMQMVKDCI